MKCWAYLQSTDKVYGMAEQCRVLLCFPWDLLAWSISLWLPAVRRAGRWAWLGAPAAAEPLSCKNHQKVEFHRGANTVMKNQQTSFHLEGCSAEMSLDLKRSRARHSRDRSACGGKAALCTPVSAFVEKETGRLAQCISQEMLFPCLFSFSAPGKLQYWNGKKNDPFAWKQSNRKSKRSDWSLLAESRIF